MWLSGYRRTLEGHSFPYHSIAPGIETALLVRGNGERPTVAWETARLEGELTDGFARFVWVFAMAVDAAPVTFTLYANDAPVLVFENPASFDPAGWTIAGRDGATLTFRVTRQDRHGDPMGFALLRLPAGDLPVGEAVHLRLTSQDRRTPTWAMVYEHEVREGVRVDPFPLVRRAEGEAVHWVRLGATHFGEEARMAVLLDGREIAHATLTFGHNVVPVPIPATETPREVELEIATEGRPLLTVTVEQQPLRPWIVHLVQHTHTDIGYTRPQTEILPEHLRFVDQALDFCDETDDWPEASQFRWTCEASWPLREYLRSRPPTQLERLRRRVLEGRIELTAMMFNLSEIADEASLLALLEPVQRLREADLPVRLAMQNDVNGLAWCLADYLPTLGIESFVMGQHTHRALACFENPTAFWWESPSGSALLGYRGEHYMTGNEWGIHGSDLASFESALLHYLRGLQVRDDALDRICIQYGGYVTDNAPPSLRGPEMIRRWNDTYLWPRLRSSTAGAFLDWVREAHSTDLPVHRAAWPDWWTDGFGSAMRETAAARRAHTDLIAVQGLAALARARGLGTPPDWTPRVQEAYDALLFWDEHTLGADESISDPTCENSMVQWGEKSAYVWEAVKRTRLLQEAALGWLAPSLPRAPSPSIVVLNPSGRARSGLVDTYVDHQFLPPERGFALLDPEGRNVPAQAMGRRSDGTTLRLQVHDVPALGHVSLQVVVSPEARSALPRHGGDVLENEHYRIELDRETGCARQVLDKALGVDLVDADAGWGMFQLVHETLGNRHQLERRTLDAVQRRGLADVRIESGIDGPIFKSLLVRGTLPGSTEPDGIRIEIRLFREEKRIQVACRMRKLPVTDPEAVYVAFPFRLPESEVVYEAQGGNVVPGRDQLPGSSSDWHTVQSFVAARAPTAEIVVSTDEVPLWQLGGINLGQFKYVAEVERPHLYSWVLNNYWVTNFRASQEGELRWRYDVTSRVRGPTSGLTRFGWDNRIPLVARALPAVTEARGEPAGTLLAEPLPSNVLLVSVRPTEDGQGLFLHLRELDGLETRIDLPRHLGSGRVRSVATVDALGRQPEPASQGVSVPPLGVCFLRVELGG